MFKALHRKLAILNALVLISFLFIFSYTIVSISSISQSNAAKLTLESKAMEIVESSKMSDSFDFIIIGDLRSRINNTKNIHYMLWYNNYIGIKSDLTTVNQDLMETMYQQAVITFESKEQAYKPVKVGEESYRLYTTYYELSNGDGGVIQVFQSKYEDDHNSNMLFYLFLRIGFAGIIILIIISSYLAKKSLEPVKKSYERQKEFIADASHELRTPLTVMKTNLELLSMKEDETIRENEKWLNNLLSETDTMSKLVQNLLTLAQLENNQMKLKMEQMNLSQLTTMVCNKMELIMSEKNISFDAIIGDEIIIRGDKSRLEQLLVILIDNAIKYTPEGGHIKISLMSTSDKVVLSVKDSGVGISPEDKKKIFDRFYRVDKVRSREQGGAGLGLSIAKWVIQEHKGTINIESKVGLGSEFIIEFPKK
ncbi:MAG: sensor histidine kinase [Eubacteriales bacterium]